MNEDYEIVDGYPIVGGEAYPLSIEDIETLVNAYNNSGESIGLTIGKGVADFVNDHLAPSPAQISWLRALAAEIRRLGQ